VAAAGALAAFRVLDLGEGVAAAYCSRLFADFGADVIKVERPGGGDPTRRWGPFPGDVADPEKSGLFAFLNTNKRGISLDLERAGGRALLDRLAARADLVIEDLPARRARALDIAWPALARANADLVQVSITPYGRTGPYAEWNGHDLNAYHLSAAGHRYCGRPGEAPLEHGTFAAEFFGAAAGATWGLAAALGRARAGGGQLVDVSCAEVIAAVFVGGQNVGAYAQDGAWERRTGVGMPLGAPATIMPCKDGHVWMLALEPHQWDGLVRVMGDPEWARAELFRDMFERARNADVIYPLLEEWTLARSKWEIMDQCQANGVPVAAVFDVAEAAEHPQQRERGYFVEVVHPRLGRVRHMGAPFKLPACPGGPARPAPLAGQHTDEVLREWAGASADECRHLRAAGVV
jgi:crotonobetainyl-CoA:carnitine CoA-transferase CaiB-like acyl-CoA transferase